MRQDGTDDGLRPSPQFAWQMGKTVASIDFVMEAERYLSSNEDQDLRTAITKIKSGSVVLNMFLSVKTYLERKPF